MLDIIYGSKLYRGSRNKEKIVAAMDSPVNAELVQQLSKYVDPDSAKKSKKSEKPTDDKPTDVEESIENLSDEIDESGAEVGSDGSKDVDDSLEELSDSLDSAPSGSDVDDEVSGELTAESLEAEVPGVGRVFEKGDETWISYNDDINLDNILWDVVEAVSKLTNDSLKFNRIARSENSVVFVNSEGSQDETGNEF